MSPVISQRDRTKVLGFVLAGVLAYPVTLYHALLAQNLLAEPTSDSFPRVLTFDQANDHRMPRPRGASFKRTKLSDEIFEIQYIFRNFNNDRLTVEFTIVLAELDGSMREYGYRKKDLDAIHAKYGSQGKAVYNRKVMEYFMSRGFRVMSEDTVMPDIPLMVRRNMKRINGLALALDRIAQKRGYGSEETIGAVIAMVQTAMQYRIPPATQGGRRIAGVMPPTQALYLGWGDCDTKSGVLATVLANWSGIRGVGLALPKHYLIGIGRIPRNGEVYVSYGGIDYVLIEPAGPAWLPLGQVGASTLAMLDNMTGVPIQPF